MSYDFDELCPHCDFVNDVAMVDVTKVNGKQTVICKNCGKRILACNLCDAENCGNCNLSCKE